MQCHSLFKNKHQGYNREYMPSSLLLFQPFWLVLKCSAGDVHVKCYGTLHRMCFNELPWVFRIECYFIEAYLWRSSIYMQWLRNTQMKKRTVGTNVQFVVLGKRPLHLESGKSDTKCPKGCSVTLIWIHPFLASVGAHCDFLDNSVEASLKGNR